MAEMLRSINPFNNVLMAEFPTASASEIDAAIAQAAKGFSVWKKSSFAERSALLMKLADILRERMHDLAEMITNEMGKPITQSIGEIDKCIWCCEHYAENLEQYLSDEVIPTEGRQSLIRNQGRGVVLAIMPWNYPFWQVFRCIVPAIAAGNSILLKHASNVPACALEIDKIFSEAEAPQGLFKVLLVSPSEIPAIIAHPAIRAVSLTGSEDAGRQVGAIAGKYLKPAVLELGGNNAWIILEDADPDLAFAGIMAGRFQNTGQSCIAAKRILIQESVYDEYVSRLQIAIERMRLGNPMEPEMELGPLARPDLATLLDNQVQESIQQGAIKLVGARSEGNLYRPTLLHNVRPGMRVFEEETFGPVLGLTPVKDLEQAIELTNASAMALGTAVFTGDAERILVHSHLLEEPMIFINSIVRSDPRLPFGGFKDSGFGRELGKDGILQFTNRQTIFVA
jgi:succinate-semialdehyde dehydrogenase/glutarate-semialdehyde dehydrogenase